MSKRLVVTGATGSQGTAVIRYFQQHEPVYSIRGLTRDPCSETAKALATSGVGMMEADLKDIDSLKQAFSGAHAIFAFTVADFRERQSLEIQQGRTSLMPPRRSRSSSAWCGVRWLVFQNVAEEIYACVLLRFQG